MSIYSPLRIFYTSFGGIRANPGMLVSMAVPAFCCWAGGWGGAPGRAGMAGVVRPSMGISGPEGNTGINRGANRPAGGGISRE